MYHKLIELHKAGDISFANVVTFNMDEYVGIPRDHPESYHSYMVRMGIGSARLTRRCTMRVLRRCDPGIVTRELSALLYDGIIRG